jgi:hypothetical protein
LALVGLNLDLCFLILVRRAQRPEKSWLSGKVSNDAGPKVSDEYLLNVVDTIDQGMAR